MGTEHQIVPGISVTPSGQAAVDPSLSDILFDLAIELEETTDLPVDIEHVVAAIVLAARKGQLDPNTPISSDDTEIANILTAHVKAVFSEYGGNVGTDE